MKQLANKLFKLHTKGLLVNLVWGNNPPQTREDFEEYIKANLQVHADYMAFHSTKVFKKLPPKQITKWRKDARERLRFWLKDLRAGKFDALYTLVRSKDDIYVTTKKQYRVTIPLFD